MLRILMNIFSHKCSICMETTLMQKKHTLYCGHAFHTDCIMTWFRSKKNTCPYCRCTGKKIEIINQPNNDESNVLISEGWQTNEHVQHFLNNENPTHNQIIEAYYIRDINMNVNIEDVFETCVRGMGINPSDYEKQIQYKFRRENEDKLKEILKHTIEYPAHEETYTISLNFNNYLMNELGSEEYKKKLYDYRQMEILKNENNHKGIYRLIDSINLHGLGW